MNKVIEHINLELFNNFSEIVYAVDCEKKIVYANNMFLKKNKTTLKKLSLKTIDNYLNSKTIVNTIDFLFKENVESQFLLTKNKMQYFFNLKKIDQKNSICIITQQKTPNRQKNLQSKLQFEEAYSELFDNISESIVIYKVITDTENNPIDFEFLEANKAYQKSIGYSLTELVGNTLLRTFPNTPLNWKEIHKNAYIFNRPFSLVDYSAKTKKYWKIKVFPLNKKRIAAISYDITNQKTAEVNTKNKNQLLKDTEEKLLQYNQELKETCEKIKISELSYKALFDHSNDGILVIKNFKIINHNEKAAQILKGAPLFNKTIEEITNSSFKKKLTYSKVISEIENHNDLPYEWVFATNGQDKINALITFSSFYQNSELYHYVIIKDLTFEEIYLEEIQENRYQIEQAQKSAKLGYWSFKLNDQNNITWSNEMLNILEALEPIPFYSFFDEYTHQDSIEIVNRTIEDFKKKPKDFDLLLKIQTPKNNIKYIRKKGQIIEKENQIICKGILQDVSEFEEQRRKVEFESKVHESLSRASTELILPSLSIDKIIQIIFKSCIELTRCEFGYIEYHQPENKNILIHTFLNEHKDNSIIKSNFFLKNKADYENQGILGVNIWSDKAEYKNNTHINIEINNGWFAPKTISNYLVCPTQINEHKIGQIVLLNAPSDFTEEQITAIKSLSNIYGLAIFRKQMEWDLIQAKEKAIESDMLKSAFLANMSHEIRTPMNAIIGFSQLLINSNFDSKKKLEFTRLINNSCNDLLLIVSDIIDISKIEAGQLELRKSSFDLHELLAEVLKLSIHKSKQRHKYLPIFLNHPLDDKFIIWTDKTRLKQVLLHLIDNAIKFTKDGTIEFGYKIIEYKKIKFFIIDKGIGIPIKEQKNIFESFRQTEETIKRTYGGTGLGLAISKNIIKQLSGNIGLESKPNEGSTFWIEIPLEGYEKKSGNISPQKKYYCTQVKEKKILIIENKPIVSNKIALYLRKFKANVKLAYNKDEALQLSTSFIPDFIFLSLNFQQQSPESIIELIKHPKIKTILYHNNEDIIPDLLKKEKNIYLHKLPFTQENLIKTIKSTF